MASQGCVSRSAAGIVRPDSVAELQRIVRQAGKSGEALQVYQEGCEGLRVSLERMNRIIEIDADNLVAQVEPGVTLGALDRALQERGLRFVPGDTSVYHSKTLGQFFYEGCSNLSGGKYGFAKHFLMGSEVVLPSGEILTTGGKTVKNVTGYDFTRFFNAPYADLGITVKFLLKLLPQPEVRFRLLTALPAGGAAFELASRLRRDKLVPALQIWSSGTARSRMGSGGDGRDWLWLELDGVAEEVAVRQRELEGRLAEFGAEKLAAAAEVEEAVRPLARAYAAIDTVLTDELKLPLSSQAAFVSELETWAAEQNIEAGVFGQIGEGKLNLIFADWGEAEHRLIRKALETAERHGGWSAGKYRRLYGGGSAGGLGQMEMRFRRMIDPDGVLCGRGVQ